MHDTTFIVLKVPRQQPSTDLAEQHKHVMNVSSMQVVHAGFSKQTYLFTHWHNTLHTARELQGWMHSYAQAKTDRNPAVTVSKEQPCPRQTRNCEWPTQHNSY